MIKTNNETVAGSGQNPSALLLQPHKKHRRRKDREEEHSMDSTTVGAVHRSAAHGAGAQVPRVHSSGRRHRSGSRHDRHNCHKHRVKTEDSQLADEVSQLKTENYLLNRRLNASLTSLDSGLPTTESLPPFDIDLKKAYQHIKHENTQLLQDVKTCRVESEKLKTMLESEATEKNCLLDDVSMLKNLVYRLNVELENCQKYRDKTENSGKIPYELPLYYNKNFLKPILPLLRAYTESIEEKNEIIATAEKNLERFNLSFNELLKENETLYRELEAKLTRGDDGGAYELKLAREELKNTREERALYENQARIEAGKLKEIQALYQTKVSTLERERDTALDKLQESRSDFYSLHGKYTVVKQELDRVRCDQGTSVPHVVHTAAIAECNRLFLNLKNEHSLEKQDLVHNIAECERKLKHKEAELEKNERERLVLEQGNCDLAAAMAEAEGRGSGGGKVEDRSQLAEALRRNGELESKLQKTKKRLQQSMVFAEDLVKEQEALLSQLHEKQRENSAMVTHFGSLKKKLKSVEKGASAGLDSVEQTINDLKAENEQLTSEVERLKKLVREPEPITFDTDDLSS